MPELLECLSADLREVLERVGPSVVQVERCDKRPWWKPARYTEGADEMGTAGAGVIIAADGVIVTSAHVVDGADGLNVQLHDGRRFEVTDRRTQPEVDVAVLRIPVHDLPVIPFDSDRRAKLGEIVVSIGHPLGFFPSTTSLGIVSHPSRLYLVEGNPVLGVQTDAAISPGNSGGPLVGCDGLVLGIVSETVEEGQNLNFAIPMFFVLDIAKRLLRGENVTFGTIGVRQCIEAPLPGFVEPVTPAQKNGLLILDLDPGIGLHRAGVEQFDWIVAVDGSPMDSLEAFFEIIRPERVGKELTVVIGRSGMAAVGEHRIKVERHKAE